MEEDKELQHEDNQPEETEEQAELMPDPEAGQAEEQSGADSDASDASVAKTIVFERSAEGGEASEIEDEAEENKEASDENGNEKEKEEALAELSDEDREIVERIRLRKIEADKKKRRTKRRLVISVTLAVLALIAIALSFTPIFTVDSIEVRGNAHYSAEEVISIGHAVPGKNLIYHSDKGVITGYLTQNPYIKSAEVSRKLPSTLVITVSERTPLMALNYDDDYLILDDEGVLLQKSRTKPKLTIVEGNVITRIKLGREIGTKDSETMERTLSIMKTMREQDLYFVKVDMTDRYMTRAYVYDSLIVKNDFGTLIENMENGKLHMVLDRLFSESIKRGTVTFNEDGTSTFMPGI